MSTNVKNLPKSSLNLQIDVKILINKKGQIHKKESKELKAAKNYKLASKGIDEGIDELMCNSFKIKSLLYKLPRNRAAGKDGIFAEHIFYADSSVCNHMSTGYFTIVETKRLLLKPLSITLFIFLFPDCHREIVNLSIY